MSVSDRVALATTTVPYDKLRAFPRLFADYCTAHEKVASRYAGNWQSTTDRIAAADHAAAHVRDRQILVEVLLDQQEAWGLDAPTRRNIEALSDPETVAVVTGQQTTVLGGPLYTPLKVLTALMQADALAEETGRRVVPVFWLEGEDHDWEEMAGTHILHRNEVVPLRYDGYALPDEGNLGAVGRLTAEERMAALIDQLDDHLPPSDFKPQVMQAVRSSYAEGTRLENAFARLLRELFPESGLVFINPDDARLKQLTAPLFARELRAPKDSSRLVNEAGEELKASYHAQVHARSSNLFLLEDEGRYPIDLAEDGFRLRGTDRRFTEEELLDLLDTQPELFSPNVVLRPLMQDMLLPTALYVAGPGEVSYFAQYKAVYDWAGIPMPVLHPRISATLVEGKVAKVLDKYEIDPADLEAGVDQLFQRLVVREMEVDVDQVFGEVQAPIHQAINELKAPVETVDRTLGKSVEATRAAIVHELSSLKERVVRAEKRNQDELYAQLQKAHANLFPAGRPQERVISALYFLNKYSPALITQLGESLDPASDAHQVVYL